jgi:hypothetical protein
MKKEERRRKKGGSVEDDFSLGRSDQIMTWMSWMAAAVSPVSSTVLKN